MVSRASIIALAQQTKPFVNVSHSSCFHRVIVCLQMLFGASIIHTEQGKEGVTHTYLYLLRHEFKLRQLWKDALAVSQTGAGLGDFY